MKVNGVVHTSHKMASLYFQTGNIFDLYFESFYCIVSFKGDFCGVDFSF